MIRQLGQACISVAELHKRGLHKLSCPRCLILSFIAFDLVHHLRICILVMKHLNILARKLVTKDLFGAGKLFTVDVARDISDLVQLKNAVVKSS